MLGQKHYNFNATRRDELLGNIKNQEFDLIILGGGITGAGILLDATYRGMKVLLLEKNDFASGTSSKSTKLIHGGLRYLKNFEFGIVKETGRERKILHQNAPHLIYPEPMLLPISNKGGFSKLGLKAGLSLYDFLAGLEKDKRKKFYRKDQISSIEPLLNLDHIKGLAKYFEYRTNDMRLTLEIIKTAVIKGGLAFNYCEAISFSYYNNKINGVYFKNQFSGQIIYTRAKHIVNAGGPWVDEIDRLIETSLDGRFDIENEKLDKMITSDRLNNNFSAENKTIHPEEETIPLSTHKKHSTVPEKILHTKGVHVVINRKKIDLRYSTYFPTSDNRMIFAIPSHNIVYLGTTDTFYKDDLNNISIKAQDADYLIQQTNRFFATQLSRLDIISSWAGLRPLIKQQGKKPSEISRKEEIFTNPSGLITIAGGKLTGYRIMAKKIVDLICKKDGIKHQCTTDQIKIYGGDFAFPELVLGFEKAIKSRLVSLKITEEKAGYLVKTYGKQCNEILEHFNKNKPEFLAVSEAWYALRYDNTHTLEDFFERRTGKLYFHPEEIRKELDAVTEEFSKFFNWTAQKIKLEQAHILQKLEDQINFHV